MTHTRALRPFVALVFAVALVGSTAVPLLAGDHLDSPALNPARLEADIGGLYVFQGADPNATVLATTVSPAAGAIGPVTFGTDVIYQFNLVDSPTTPTPFGFKADEAYRATFGSPDSSGNQAFKLYKAVGSAADGHSVDPANLIHSGMTNQNTTFAAASGTAHFFAGLRSDPFFFDLAGFQGSFGEQSNGRAFNDGMQVDFFQDLEVLALVLELPDGELPDAAGDGFATWASTAVPVGGGWDQVDRIGRPAINMFVNSTGSLINAPPGNKDLFNQTQPGSDSTFQQAVKDALAALSALDSEGPYDSSLVNSLTAVFLPDTLFYDKDSTAPPPFNSAPFNGRRLEDDVIDIELNLLTGGPPFTVIGRDSKGGITTDGIGPHADYLSVFPYLGPPRPIATPDSYATPHATLLEALSVLGNDRDPGGEFMFAIKDSDPAVGSLDFFTSGEFRYTPPAGFSGEVSFQYHIEAGSRSSAPALVTITVQEPTGTVAGTVLLDGLPLADVEVWLAEDFGSGGQVNHYACTDSAGAFSFPGIALGVPLISATGPSVSAGCGNGDFVDPANGAHLQTQYYDHRHVLSMADVFTLPKAPSTAPTGRTTMTLRYDILYEGHNLGMVDTSQGLWHLRAPFGEWVQTFYYGDPGDIPFVGDWDCDGVATPGLFRQSDAFAYLRNSNSAGIADIRFFFGDPADIPLAGDFNGNGCDTLSLYRPAEQRFYIINQLGENEGGLGAADYTFDFGNPGDTPFVGDFDGDGLDEVGLHRASTGLVYFENALIPNGGGGAADVQFIFGDPGDRFVAGGWVASGFDSPALFRSSDETWYLKFANNQGNADATIQFGESPWLPVAGFWGLPRTAP